MSRRSLTVPAAEANRSFSKLLRAARLGARITITSHGEPVLPELGPVGGGGQRRRRPRLHRRREAHDALMAHLEIGRADRHRPLDA